MAGDLRFLVEFVQDGVDIGEQCSGRRSSLTNPVVAGIDPGDQVRSWPAGKRGRV